MRMHTAVEVITSTLRRNPGQAIYISGAPGLGKTSMAYDIADSLEIPRPRVLLFRPSLRDPCDLMGLPASDQGSPTARFKPAEEFYQFREGTGPGMILLDELPQAITQMQNACAGLLLDKQIGPLRIDPNVIMIATGNRTKDKAGANRVVSQLGNRVMHLELEAHLDDWCKWAFASNIDALIIAFLRLRPNMLHDFEPDRLSNPTPRSWEMVSRSCDPHLSRDAQFLSVAGLVGEGAAAEYIGFRDMAAKMPSIDGILVNPGTAEVPDEPGVLYAVYTALAMRTTKGNFDRIMQYLERLPVEFSTMAVKDAITKDPAVTASPAFTKWAVANSNVFC